jgi:hypothetical protein
MKWNRKSKSVQPTLRVLIHGNDQLTPDSEYCSPMSLGVHLSPKTTEISSSTWPKMKRSESNSGDVDVARIVRPQTATLERPRILDVTLLGKIDMSLTRKGLLSISNLCIAPLDSVEASRDVKRNSTRNRETRHGGKTRRWNTPRKAINDKDRTKEVNDQYRSKGQRTDWDEEENSVSESSVSVRRVSRTVPVSRSPSRGTQRAGDKGISPVNSFSSNANSPRRTAVKPPEKSKRLSPANSSNNGNSPSRGPPGKPAPREQRLSPVSSVSSTANSPSRGPTVKKVSREKRAPPIGSSGGKNVSEDIVEKPRRRTCKRPVIVKKDGKNVDEVFGGPKPKDEVPEPCRTCGRPEQPERFHSHPPPSSHRQRQHDDNNNDDKRPAVTKSSVRKPVPMKYRSGRSKRRESGVAAPGGEASLPTRVPNPDAKKPELQHVGRKSPRPGAGGVFLVLDDRGSDKPVARSGPRTVLCYLCGREFGTASYPLHEPHCLQVSASNPRFKDALA